MHGGMHQVKPEGHQQAGAGVLHIEFYTQRRGSIAHHRLGDAVNSDGVVAQHVLRQTNDCPGKQAGNRIAARHGKKVRNQQRQVDIVSKERKPERQKRLQKKRQQRNADRYRDAEPVDFNLLIGCVSDGHAIVGCSGPRAAWHRPAAGWARLPELVQRSSAGRSRVFRMRPAWGLPPCHSQRRRSSARGKSEGKSEGKSDRPASQLVSRLVPCPAPTRLKRCLMSMAFLERAPSLAWCFQVWPQSWRQPDWRLFPPYQRRHSRWWPACRAQMAGAAPEYRLRARERSLPPPPAVLCSRPAPELLPVCSGWRPA